MTGKELFKQWRKNIHPYPNTEWAGLPEYDRDAWERLATVVEWRSPLPTPVTDMYREQTAYIKEMQKLWVVPGKIEVVRPPTRQAFMAEVKSKIAEDFRRGFLEKFLGHGQVQFVEEDKVNMGATNYAPGGWTEDQFNPPTTPLNVKKISFDPVNYGTVTVGDPTITPVASNYLASPSTHHRSCALRHDGIACTCP